jgi:hypothetical protein
MGQSTFDRSTVNRGRRSAPLAVLILAVWSAGAWITWARSSNIRTDPGLVEDLSAYESVRPELDGVEEAWILLEPPTKNRQRKRMGGQAQRAQYALAPTVVHRLRSPNVAAFRVRVTDRKTIILQFFLDDDRVEKVRALLKKTAERRGLRFSGRQVATNLYLYRVERKP